MQIKEIIPKLWYWKKAAWTRPQALSEVQGQR